MPNQEVTITSSLSQPELEAEFDQAWSLLKTDPQLVRQARAAGIDVNALPARRDAAVVVKPGESAAIPPLLVDFLVGLVSGLTIEGLKLLIGVIQRRKGNDAIGLK
jgi:hypothetical protein